MNPEIYSVSGCQIELLGRKSADAVWARRVGDNRLRYYFHSELRTDGGWQTLCPLIATLPSMRRAVALAKIANRHESAS